jgi:hypothetical protein
MSDELETIVGKTIKGSHLVEAYDVDPYGNRATNPRLVIEFTDGTRLEIEHDYIYEMVVISGRIAAALEQEKA